MDMFKSLQATMLQERGTDACFCEERTCFQKHERVRMDKLLYAVGQSQLQTALKST